ncbi:MAG: hypothetical protein VYD49_06535 [Pseudomonadota bacterium]|nr:hypothetical protein [Pseudomonadota bacterium]
MNFATLGPEDSNHALVLARYLELRRQDLGGKDSPLSPTVQLVNDFPQAFQDLVDGHHDYVLQVSAHFSHADCVGRFMHRAFPVDSFIAPSRPLALVARKDVANPTSVLRQPATRHYTDLTGLKQRDAPTIVAALEGLLDGQADAAIVAEQALALYPDQLRLMRPLGPALDTWILYANRPLMDEVQQEPALGNSGALREHFRTTLARKKPA